MERSEPSRKRLFIGLLTGTSLTVCAVLALLWIIPYVGLKNIHPAAPWIMGVVLGAVILLVLWAGMALSASGIQDTSPLPVYGVLNERPHGPCLDTTVSLAALEQALRYFLKTLPDGPPVVELLPTLGRGPARSGRRQRKPGTAGASAQPDAQAATSPAATDGPAAS